MRNKPKKTVLPKRPLKKKPLRPLKKRPVIKKPLRPLKKTFLPKKPAGKRPLRKTYQSQIMSAPAERNVFQKVSDYILGAPPLQNVQEFYEKYLKIDTLLGGSYLYAYHVNGRLLVLFGDYHGHVCDKASAGRAEHLRTFLRDLFTVSQSCVDFFLETTQFSKVSKSMYAPEHIDYLRYMQAHHLSDTPETDEEIEEVFHEFHGCFSQERKCEYTKTRFHNFEYRRLLTERNIRPLVFNKIFTLAEKETDPVKLRKHYTALLAEGGYSRFLYMILSGDLSQVLSVYDRLFSVFFNSQDYFTRNFTVADLEKSMYHLVHKQLTQLPLSERITVIRYLKSEIDITNRAYLQQLRSGNAGSITSIKVILMDMYALPRLLKSLFTYSDSNVVVCYGGNAHLNRYAKFIQKVLGNRAITNDNVWYSPGNYPDNPDPGCIRTKNVKWVPFMNALLAQLSRPGKGCHIKKFIL